MVGTGSYGVPEAARFARVPVRTASRWVTGSGDGRTERLLPGDLPSVDGRRALSFLDLVDLLVVGRFREAGVSLQAVRRVYRRLSEHLETLHPFGQRQFLTDGRAIFLQTADEIGDPQLIEVLSGQRAMDKVLRPYLKQIDYSPESQAAVRWNIAEGVVLDPARSFGKPIVAAEGTTTFVLAESFWANDKDTDLVADLFDVSPEAVRQAVAFESDYFPRRAA